MNRKIRRLAEKIVPACSRTENEIHGRNGPDSSAWGRHEAVRHARTLFEILEYSKLFPDRKLRILNASGTACGHQDFSLAEQLRENSIPFEWTIIDSPENRHLDHPVFIKLADYLGITVRRTDLRHENALSRLEKDYNIILFTEIAEHLDFSVFLRTLSTLRSAISHDGRLILTTPNLLSIWNRINFLLGRGNRPFWGDGMQNLSTGLFGHIAGYDATRLENILNDLGFDVIKRTSFVCMHELNMPGLVRRCACGFTEMLCDFGAMVGTTLLITAGPSGTKKEIPFQV